MTTLNKLTFFQYKNYASTNLDFWGKIVCICGGNGTGKTNLMDAIYYLSYTKSYLGFKDAQMVQHQATGISILGDFEKLKEKFIVKIISRDNAKKELTVNGLEVKQHYTHAGSLPCVFIGPDDIEIITGSSELRRKLIDATISQVDKSYLLSLSKYNKVLLQRNSLLKYWHESGKEIKELMPFYEAELANLGQQIYNQRKAFLEVYLSAVSNVYDSITSNAEPIYLEYVSKLNDNTLQDLFKQSIEKDILLGRTTCGVHKDDIYIGFSDTILLKETASQGQKKTMLFALKLAQFQYLKLNLQQTPILLLDDVFEKLDTNRSKQLLQFIAEAGCQVFITDTQKGRLQQHFEGNKAVQYVDM